MSKALISNGNNPTAQTNSINANNANPFGVNNSKEISNKEKADDKFLLNKKRTFNTNVDESKI